MKSHYRRTGIAALLTALAVSVPCVAWYVAGSRAAAQEAAATERAPLVEAREIAQRLAHQLTVRLDAMRHNESRRSPFDYHHWSGTVPDGVPLEVVADSSLAEGPADPLIWAHFQMDEVGQLSLPTMSSRAAALAESSRQSIELAIFDELECATSRSLAALRRGAPDGDERVIPSAEGVVTVGPFEWFTVWSIKDQPALVALRKVATPGAVLTQGFVVLAEDLTELVADPELRVIVRPAGTPGPAEAVLALDGQRWTVSLDPARGLAAAATEAGAVRRRFHWTFLGGSALALAAGFMLVGLVWQADRLALRRAQFAASAAHELRTPLAGMRLYGEMLAGGLGRSEHRGEYARRIADEAERLGHVVSNVLGYSRLERGGLQVHPATGDLVATVNQSVNRLRPVIEAKGATLRLEIPPRVPNTWFDGDAVHQMLQNLVDNAEKYSRAAEDRTIVVRLEPEERAVVLSVIDRGKGVAPALRRTLFRPFVRHSDPSAPAGLGIGLALVQALARAQLASVQHADEPGGGSRFSIRFRC